MSFSRMCCITISFLSVVCAMIIGGRTSAAGPPKSDVKQFDMLDVKLQAETEYWSFSNSEFRGSISKKTGMLVRLTSLKPSPVEMIPENGKGLTVYIENQNKEWYDEFDRVDEASVGVGADDGYSFRRLSVSLKPTTHNAAGVDLEYRILADSLRIIVKFKFLTDDADRYRAGVFQSFNKDEWPEQQYVTGTFPSGQAMNERYSYQQGYYDDKKWVNALYPMSLLISKSRHFLWGYLDLGAHVVVNPNGVEPGTAPSFMVCPQGIKKGQSYTFDFVCKTFTRPKNTYTEVLRWYGEHFYNSDPDFNQGPVRLEHEICRTLGPGNMAMYGVYASSLIPGIAEDREAVLAAEDWMLKHNFVHLWSAGINDWRESSPSSGAFILPYLLMQSNAEDLKAEVKRLQRKGFKFYMYFRQAWFFTKKEWESEKDVDQPPYKRWLNKNSDGKPKAYEGWDFYPKEPKFIDVAKRLGFDEPIIGAEIDFNNDEARAWYLKRLQECVEYYNVDGIAWDFGWLRMYAEGNVPLESAADPDSDMHQGWLKIQYDTWKWLKKKHPEKKVIINNVGGTPSQLYADAVLLEFGPPDTSSGYYAAAKAFNTEIITLQNLSWETRNRQSLIEKWGGNDGFQKRLLSIALPMGSIWGDCPTYAVPHNTRLSFDHWMDYYPVMNGLPTEYSSFSARAGGLPLVTCSDVLTTNSSNVVGSVWASEQGFIAAIIFDDADTGNIDVKIDRGVLERCGQTLSPKPPNMSPMRLKLTVMDADLRVRETGSSLKYTTDKQYLRISGDMHKGELLLVERVD